MLAALLRVQNFERYDVGAMKLLGYGASPLPPATIREAMARFGCPFLQMYGTTELLGMSHMLFPSDHVLGLGGAARAAGVDREGAVVGRYAHRRRGQSRRTGRRGGQLLVRSDVVFPGYWRAPQKTEEMFFEDWLRTGDLARHEEAGYVYLADRVKFRFKTGGYNVFLTEIENVLAEHPAVHEVSVFGLPDPVWGDRIEAVVSLKPQQAVSTEAHKDFCRDKIANFKIPKRIEI
jgi:acyl-CoA synthetase (AMP-forming)/AMP-acid ligase II